MRKVYCTDFRVLVTFPRDSGNGFIKRSFFETIQTLQGFAGQRLSLSALSVPLLPQPLIRARYEALIAFKATEVHDVLGTFRRQCGVKGNFLATFAATDSGGVVCVHDGVSPSSKKT